MLRFGEPAGSVGCELCEPGGLLSAGLLLGSELCKQAGVFDHGLCALAGQEDLPAKEKAISTERSPDHVAHSPTERVAVGPPGMLCG